MPKTRVNDWTLTMLSMFSLSILGCGSEDVPTAAEDPVDPAGVWTFGIVVTEATGFCTDEQGDSSAHPITITKTGSAPPYSVTASGFLGDPDNVLTGTFDENNRLVITGNYPEDQGRTTPTHDLVATSENRMEGIETWSYTTDPGIEPSGSCTDQKSDVTADRIL